MFAISSFFIIFFIIALIGIVATFIKVFFFGFLAVKFFQSKALNQLDLEHFQTIDKKENDNKSYIKLNCDSCGAKCRDASKISPSGDLQCNYCGTWFNVIRD